MTHEELEKIVSQCKSEGEYVVLCGGERFYAFGVNTSEEGLVTAHYHVFCALMESINSNYDIENPDIMLQNMLAEYMKEHPEHYIEKYE